MFWLVLFSCKDNPTTPDVPIYAEIYEGIYERVYPVTYPYVTRLPDVDIYPTEIGGMVWTTTQLDDNRFEFKTVKVLKPNYPRGRPYEIRVEDKNTWTEERVLVGRNIYLNGKLLQAIFTAGDQEFAKFRIDGNNVVYNAFEHHLIFVVALISTHYYSISILWPATLAILHCSPIQSF